MTANSSSQSPRGDFPAGQGATGFAAGNDGHGPTPGGGTPGGQAPADRAGKPRPAKGTREFWRAMRFVWPYRKTILISVVCAFFVGLAASATLTAITPILNVLLNDQTVHQWADATIAEKRLGVRLLDRTPEVQLAEVEREKAAALAGLQNGDRLLLPNTQAARNSSEKHLAHTVAALADPAARSIDLIRQRGEDLAPVRVPLKPVPPQLYVLRKSVSLVSTDPVWAIGEIFVVLALLATFGNGLKFFQEYLSDKVAISAIMDIRRKLYDHILHVPMSHFGRRGTSDVTSRLVQDSAALEIGFKTVLGQSVQQPIVASMALGVAVWTSWKLTMIIGLFAPLMAFTIQKFGKKMRRAARAALQKNSTMLGQINGTLIGVRVVKAANAERAERRRYRGIMQGLMGEQLRMSKLEAAGSPIMETITLMTVGLVVLIATYMVTKSHTLSVNEFFLVMACLATMGDSMRRLNKVNGVLQRANAGAQRIFEVIAMPTEKPRERRYGLKLASDSAAGEPTDDSGDAEPAALTTVAEPPAAKLNGSATTFKPKMPALQREVRFEHITFAYPGAATPVLHDVSLAVPKGTRVAVVGRNGSGKTTLLALLPRFYDADQGRITVDGTDIRSVSLSSLRNQISLVTQDSVIFPGTIAENIAYGHPLAGLLRAPSPSPAVRQLRSDVESAARRAFAHDFILEKPAGYETVLDGLGSQLSGGQKQRLCIARAILRNSPILILDEATSQVDAESEHLIQQAIDGLMHVGHDPATGQATSTAPTTFVIAHRFATIRSADVIVVMDRGQIIGQGKHDDLLRTCETYQQLYERQLGGAE